MLAETKFDPFAHARTVRARLMNPPNAVVDERLRAELKTALQKLATAHLTIKDQARTIEALKALPVSDSARPAEIAMGLKHRTLREIILGVSEQLGISIQGMMSRGRTDKLVHARQLAFYLTRNLTTLSLTQIGRRFERDHATVIHGIAQIEAKLSTDEKLRADIDAIKARL
jgi:chromosomal replication initiation ATPase DnaA